VAAGLARSLARPGGNVTGLSSSFDDTIAKQVEVLTELSPRMARIALLLDSTTTPTTRARFDETVRKVAQAKGLTAVAVALGNASELDRAFDEMKSQRAEGLIVPMSGIAYQHRREIADKARQVGLPAVSAGGTQHAELGMLMTYGVNFQQSYRYAVRYVDRILKGAKPADLPIEQYGRFELVINLKTARAMGLKVPQSLLLRADRVIE
jgi:putative ABC transport system substrate-binding protein